ncbi:Lrp/AsnC family transcriptional regulator [Bacillus sp. Marseille-P3800]|uniref:Lrp/AsnC family transcriptional regulator n=1 Tax=Bacillus sp. Marseille-P3800 TaxID=2014782 RepID=UPI000C068778|nr:Lrp/AsnC family transcriptional regulator [Bacillus sp. Marseille-P3800]
MEKLDALDFKILDLYQKDGKFTYSQIARQLNVSEGTVRQRSKRMVHNGVFDFIIKIDPSKLGLSVKAIIGVSVAVGKQDEVGKWLASYPEILCVDSVSGYHHFIVQAYFNSNEHLIDFINGTLTKSPAILTMDVSIQLKGYKDSIDYLLTSKDGKSII